MAGAAKRDPKALKGFLLVISAATFWGVAGVTVKFLFVSRNLDPVALAQVRVTLCFLTSLVVLGLARPRLLRIKAGELPFLAFYGLCGITATQITYYLAIHESNVAVAIFLQFLAPILTSIYEVVILRRRPGRFTALVLALAVGGAVLLVLGGGAVSATRLGITWGLISAVALAAYTLIGREGVRRMDPWTLLVGATGMSALFWAIVHPVWLLPFGSWNLVDWGFFLYLAVFTTFLPFGLYLTGLRYIGATSAIVAATLEPVWATVLAGLFLGEGLAFVQVAGCLSILTAIVSLQALPGAAIVDGPTTQAAQNEGAPASRV